MPPDPAARPVLDLRGVRCPLSWAKAKVELERRARGDVVELLVDDPQAGRDIPRAAEAAGHHVAGLVEQGGTWRITIEV
jgi:TusA-related sulfurtransferase